ncbi:MAG: phosphoenolpyruvate--protein phosphotransferase [Thermodesulfobacteriota bacterium]|nr:phosphoenolpyruvate--protein phosphotransferase [Thermodesulfobacteriota bacterium]
MTDRKSEIKLVGVPGSPGICIGKAYLVDTDSAGVEVVEKYFIKKENIQSEASRFKSAVKSAREELTGIIESIPEDLWEHVHILETHKIMFKDKMLYGKTLDTIENEQVNAEWALKKVVVNVKSMFRDIEDPYIRGRISDIVHVSDRIMRHLLGTTDVNIGKIDKRVILVAHDLSPADTSQIQLERIKGFITDRGGRTSHTAIIAKTLDIPSVLGLEKATSVIENDDIIIVDGERGVIIVNPSEESLLTYQNRQEVYFAYKADIAKTSHLPAETTDGVRLNVLGNIELPTEISQVKGYGGDGIGLFRTEFLYLSRKDFPNEEELFSEYKKVVEQIAPQPVTIRTLDINGDKAIAFDKTDDEVNPALGLRAIRFCLRRPDIFETQLRAILRAAVYGNVKIMFPMISGYEEVQEAIGFLDKASESLTKDGVEHTRNIDVGVMIEVPSAVIIADILADMVDFFSIGTNDLVQYSLAIDRGNRQVAYLFQSLHPAVIRMIKHVIEVSSTKGVDVVMCGEMAGIPTNLPVLLGLGMNALSMNPPAIPVIKNAIRSLSVADSRAFMEDVLAQSSAEGVNKLVAETFGDLLMTRQASEA